MKKALKITVNVLAWTFLVLALLVTLVVFSSEKNNGVSNIMGYMPMTVESNSMSPTFKKGDLIIVKEIDDVGSLKEDDVITFWTIIDGQRTKNTHRIVKVEKNGDAVSFITRGDNNNGIDDELPVSSGDIIGKWTDVRVVGAGKVMDFLRTKRGFFICIIIPMALFFLFELYKFIVTLIDVRKDDEEEIDEEEIKRRAIEEYLAEQKKKEAEANAGAVKEAAVEKAEDAAEVVKEAAEEVAEDAAETVNDAADEVTEDAVEAVNDAADEVVKETAEEVAEDAAETVNDAADEVTEDAVEAVNDAADEVTEDTVEAVNDAADEETEDAAEAVNETAEEVAEDAAEAVNDAAEEIAETVNDDTEPKDLE